MRLRLAPFIVIALVPTLAVARPKKNKKPKRPTPTKTEPATPTAPIPAPTPPPTTTMPATTTGGTTTGPGAGPGTSAVAPTTPATAPTPAPAVTPPPEKSEPEPPEGADVDALRQEYLSLRDELFRSRARASAVASQLYSTRIQVKLTYTTGRFYNPAKATIRLDGASIYDNATGAIATDDGIRFDGYVAPGRHLITFRVEAIGKDDDTFTSVTESQIVVKAVAGKDLVVAAKAKDTGDIAYEWKKKESGSYGLGIDVGVTTQARAAGK